MRKLIIAILFLLVVTLNIFSQSTSICSSVIIQSPAVEKPREVAVVSATCSTVVVSWQGSSGKSYLVSGVYRNPVSGAVLDSTDVVSTYSCNNASLCQATLPVSSGSTLSFSVIAVSMVNGQTLHSYPARLEDYYSVAACTKAAAKTTETARLSNPAGTEDKLSVSNEKLAAFPNPVGSTINIRWSSEYRGSATLSLVDGTGKAVQINNIQKDKVDYQDQLSAKGLPSGIYYVEIKTANGKAIVSRFIKQ